MTRSEGEQSRPSRRLGITGYVGLVREGYDELVKAIIRPPRAEYSLNDLGPSEFRYGGVDFVRQDVSVPNRRGLALCGSLWRRADLEPGSSFPCVVYLHGNASCRAEATTIASQVLALGAALFSFDFAGCGLSEGNYISLGFFERDDVETMIGWLREYAGVGAVALWGRSMGAVSSVMQAARDPSIAGLVLDSPFASLEQAVPQSSSRLVRGSSCGWRVGLSSSCWSRLRTTPPHHAPTHPLPTPLPLTLPSPSKPRHPSLPPRHPPSLPRQRLPSSSSLADQTATGPRARPPRPASSSCLGQ